MNIFDEEDDYMMSTPKSNYFSIVELVGNIVTQCE